MRMIFFDLETGGLDVNAPIIQIAAAVVDQDKDWEIIHTFERKCKFLESDADPQALAINHYDPKVWQVEAMHLDDAMSAFNNVCKTYADVQKISKNGKPYRVAQLAGFNTEAFDMPRIQQHFEDRCLFFAVNMWSYDTLQLVRWKTLNDIHKFPNHKLETVCKEFQIEHNAHDALGDVLATVELTRKLLL